MYITGTKISASGYRGEYFSTSAKINLNTGAITANEFIGNLDGQANSAIYDNAGNNIANTYVNNLSAISGSTAITIRPTYINTGVSGSSIDIPYNNGQYCYYASNSVSTFQQIYAAFDSSQIIFDYSANATSFSRMIHGKISIFPFAASPEKMGEVFFNFYWRPVYGASTSLVYNGIYYDPKNLLAQNSYNQEFAFVIDNSDYTGYLSIPHIQRYATYAIEAYVVTPSLSRINLINSAANTSVKKLDSTQYSVFTNINSDTNGETGRYYRFSRQTLSDVLSGQTINASASYATSAIYDGGSFEISKTYVADLKSSGATASGFYISPSYKSTATTGAEIFIPDQKVKITEAHTGTGYITGTSLSNSTHYGGESFTTSAYIDFNTGNIIAPTFSGTLSGRATSAIYDDDDSIYNEDNSIKANSLTISQKYIANLAVSKTMSGATLTGAKGETGYSATVDIPENWCTEYTAEDVNVLKTPGRYIISNPTSYSYYANLPQVYDLSNATWQIEVKNINSTDLNNSTRVEQQAHTIYRINSNVKADFKFCRYYLSADGWSPWVRETPYVAERIFASSGKGFDLNNLIIPGRYATGSAIMNYVTNKPVATTGKGWEINVRELLTENNQYLLQEARDASNKRYWRTTNSFGTAWTDWTQENQISMTSELTSSALTINLYQENSFASAVSFPVATTTAVPIYSGQTN